MNLQLSYFHSAGSSVGGGLGNTNDELKEPSGVASSEIVCMSNGNVGTVVGCCRFAHHCSRCTGPQRAKPRTHTNAHQRLPLRTFPPTAN